MKIWRWSQIHHKQSCMKVLKKLWRRSSISPAPHFWILDRIFWRSFVPDCTSSLVGCTAMLPSPVPFYSWHVALFTLYVLNHWPERKMPFGSHTFIEPYTPITKNQITRNNLDLTVVLQNVPKIPTVQEKKYITFVTL